MRWLALVVVAACRTASPATVSNVAPGSLTALPTDEELGGLAIAPADEAGGNWVPASSATAIVPAAQQVIGGAVAYDHAGRSVRLRRAGDASIHYGCDNNTLAVRTFEATEPARLAPGVVWLPADSVTGTALHIVSRRATAVAHGYEAGPLAIDLTRTDPTHGNLVIAWDGRVVHEIAIERPAMEGADDEPMDLSRDEVAVPVPEAAWQVDGGRAILVVLRTASYEGTSFDAVVVGETGARAVSRLSFYLYYCAF